MKDAPEQGLELTPEILAVHGAGFRAAIMLCNSISNEQREDVQA
jgi:hypothetical protein